MKLLKIFKNKRKTKEDQPWQPQFSPETSGKLLALGISNAKPKSALK